jgi:hypothetical protein
MMLYSAYFANGEHIVNSQGGRLLDVKQNFNWAWQTCSWKCPVICGSER